MAEHGRRSGLNMEEMMRKLLGWMLLTPLLAGLTAFLVFLCACPFCDIRGLRELAIVADSVVGLMVASSIGVYLITEES